MLHLTDLMLAPDLSLAGELDWLLPQPTLDLLGRTAPTNLPVLCTACFGAAFRRIASALHLESGRDELILVDLRRTAGTVPAGLPDGARAARTTLALDGIEHLDAAAQDVLGRALARAPYRLLSATDASLDELRARWRADLLALLGTVTVHAPALARRGAAIGTIAERRLTVLARALARDVPALAADAIAALAAHPWPGDLTELDAVLARTLLHSSAPAIDAAALRWEPGPPVAGAKPSAALPDAEPPARTGDAGSGPATSAAPGAGVGLEALAATEATAAPAAPAEGEIRLEDLPAPGLFRAKSDVASAPPANASGGASPTVEALAVELAHQLKNPLVTIKTFVGSIDSLCEDPHELGQFRALTDEAVTRMDEILDGLLAFARLHSPTLEALDVLPLLRDALRAAWRGFASKQVALEAPEGATLRARIDREHVRFALASLARHVAETIEARGTLAIQVEAPSTLCLVYRESGASTHLRGAGSAGDSGLPLALLLVRGALGRVGGDVDIALDGNVVSIRLCLSPP